MHAYILLTYYLPAYIVAIYLLYGTKDDVQLLA